MAVQTSFSTTRTSAFPGTPVGNESRTVETMRNDEATAEIAFGVAIKHGSTTDEQDGLLLTASQGEIIAGIVMHSHSYDQTQLGDDGVLPGALLNVVRKGRLRVLCEDGCNVGDPLHIRAVATGAELAGACLAAADGADTIDCSSQGEWRTQAAAGALADLEFDFTGQDEAFTEFQLHYDNASLTADLTVVLDAPARRFRVDRARHYNATGLVADATNFMDIRVLIGTDLAANYSTETGQEGTIAAAGFPALTNGTLALRTGAADEVISLFFEEGGAVTFPVGRTVIDCSYY